MGGVHPLDVRLQVRLAFFSTGLLFGVSRTYDNNFRFASWSVNGANAVAPRYDVD
jgi:hypothetical protein